MSEWRRTPLAMHQRRGAGGGVRACGARERARAEAGDSGEQRSGERQHRRWYCTAEYCGRGGSRHFRESPFGLSFFVPATLLSPRCSAVPRVPMCTACVLWLLSLYAKMSLYSSVRVRKAWAYEQTGMMWRLWARAKSTAARTI